jgi:hypothetical protein
LRGDFAEVRRLAAAAEKSSDESEKKHAAEAMARIANDPLILGITLGCLLLFALVATLMR